jgi:hypothetical protein
MAHRRLFPLKSRALGGLFSLSSLLALGCGGSSGQTAAQGRVMGQSDFQSVSPSSGSRGGGTLSTGDAAAVPSANAAGTTSTTTPTRTVEETDLYRLDGDRLYYLNAYRGLMVFDVSNVDAPKLLGRSAIYGSPVEMIVRNGIASVVVADWYGTDDQGQPFYGSIVRGIDATDPANMKILGDARLGGWVRDTRVVGDVLYAVTEDYGSYFGGYGGLAVADGVGYASSQATVSVASVNIAGGQVVTKGNYKLPGEGGIFNVTANSILLAHSTATTDANGNQVPTGNTELVYLDISDPAGAIVPRGSLSFPGYVQGWGADNGRWNLDFADGKTAHALGCGSQYCGNTDPLVLATADFSQPDAPTLSSTLQIPSTGWSAAARFDSGRMYLTPGSDYYYGSSASPALPLQIYDLSDPKAPFLAGSTQLAGEVWNLIPSGNRLFALGSETTETDPTYTSSQVSLRYVDVTNAAQPSVIGTSKFGDGWAWTPAAGTFKAFTMDKDKGLVVLHLSGWDSASYTYNNGLQLIEFDDSSLQTAGASHTKGWVERGIFVNTRLVSLSDLALSVVDYTDKLNPQVVTELTLARNVVNVRPVADSVAELSSDWWGNDLEHSTLRILPASQAEDNVSGAATDEVDIAGENAQSFANGSLAYIVSNVCSSEIAADPTTSKGGQCQAWTQEIQVVDYSTGAIQKRGVVRLPDEGYYYYYPGGFYGYYWYDWYNGSDVVQVGGDALAFRRWTPTYDATGSYVDSQESLFMVDLSNADAPAVASTVITTDPNGWWGDMRAVGNQLYTSHYEWERASSYDNNVYDPGVVRYYLDRIDYSDRAHPRVGQKVNVPGMLIGASATDPTVIYTLDYRWNGSDSSVNDFDVLKLDGDLAYLQGTLELPGWAGNTFVRGQQAYMSIQTYDDTSGASTVSLLQLDLSDPHTPRVLAAPAQQGWGWLVGVEGDRALVSSGWANQGIDVYRLSDTGAPTYDQFIRTRGWGLSSLARQGNQLFLSSGYWGTQVVNLNQ